MVEHSSLNQVIPDRAGASLVSIAEQLTSEHDHPLVRARALLAWGAQSDPGDFDAADLFFAHADRSWLPYAAVAVQGKTEAERDERYRRWSGEGRGLGRLADSIRAQRFAWSKI